MLPGEHPHSDRPNWRPADNIEDYYRNCQEGLEQYSDARVAKLLGVPRVEVWRWKMMARLPEELFDYILASGLGPSTKALAQVAQALASGSNLAEVQRCPHCGGVLRLRGKVSDKLVEVVNACGSIRESTDETSRPAGSR